MPVAGRGKFYLFVGPVQTLLPTAPQHDLCGRKTPRHGGGIAAYLAGASRTRTRIGGSVRCLHQEKAGISDGTRPGAVACSRPTDSWSVWGIAAPGGNRSTWLHIERTGDQHRQDWRGAPDLELVLQVDGWARQRVRELQGQGVVTSADGLSMKDGVAGAGHY